MQPQQHQQQQQQQQQQQPPPFAGFAHVPTFPLQYSAAAVTGQQQPQQPQQQHYQQQPQPQQLAPSPPIAVGASGAAGGLLMPMGVSHPLSGHHAVAPVAAGSVSQSMADSVLSCDDAASHSHNQGGLRRSVGRGGGPAPLVKAAGGPQGAPPPTYQQTAAAMHHQQHHQQQQQQQQQAHHHQATTPLLQQPSTASGNTTPQSGQSPAGPRLLVQHIPLEVTEAELQNLFEQFGAVESARQVMDRESRLPRGHGFVLFKNTADAAAARAALNGFRMYGKTLRVTFATDRARQSQQQQQQQQQSSILAMSGDGSSGHFGPASGPGGNAPSLNASASHNNPGNSSAAPGNSASHLRGAPIIAGRSAPPGGESTALNDSMSLSLSHSQQHHAAYGRSALGGSAAYGGGGGGGPSTSPGRSAQPVPGGSAYAAPPPPPYGVASASPGAPAPPQYAAMPRVGQPQHQQQQQQPPQYFSVSPQQQPFVPQQPQQPQQWAAALPSFEPGVTSGAPQHGGRA